MLDSKTIARAAAEGYTLRDVIAASRVQAKRNVSDGCCPGFDNRINVNHQELAEEIYGHCQYVGGYIYSGTTWRLDKQRLDVYGYRNSSRVGESVDPLRTLEELVRVLQSAPVGARIERSHSSINNRSSETLVKTATGWKSIHAHDSGWECGEEVHCHNFHEVAAIMGVTPSNTFIAVFDEARKRCY